MYPAVKCPKCGRVLPADGEVTVDGATVPVYSCPECVTRTTFMDEKIELPLTFIVGADGKPHDPAGAKAARMRKLRAAGTKTSVTRKRRAPGRKAAVTRKRKSSNEEHVQKM